VGVFRLLGRYVYTFVRVYYDVIYLDLLRRRALSFGAGRRRRWSRDDDDDFISGERMSSCVVRKYAFVSVCVCVCVYARAQGSSLHRRRRRRCCCVVIYIHTDSRMRARSSVEVQVNKDISAHGRCYVHMCECVGEYARALGLDLEHPPSAQPPRILVTRISSMLFRQVRIVLYI